MFEAPVVPDRVRHNLLQVSNSTGLLLDGLAPRARGKHIRLSFSEWPLASDSIRHDMFEVPVVPDSVRHNFLKVQGLKLEKTLPFDVHNTPEARKHIFLRAMIPQTRDNITPRNHNAPDTSKHDVIEGPEA